MVNWGYAKGKGTLDSINGRMKALFDALGESLGPLLLVQCGFVIDSVLLPETLSIPGVINHVSEHAESCFDHVLGLIMIFQQVESCFDHGHGLIVIFHHAESCFDHGHGLIMIFQHAESCLDHGHDLILILKHGISCF